MNIGKLTKMAKNVVDTKGDKIAAGIDKATDLVDKKTKGKHRDKLAKLDDLAQKLDKNRVPRAAAGTADPPGAAGTTDPPGTAGTTDPPGTADPPLTPAGPPDRPTPPPSAPAP